MHGSGVEGAIKPPPSVWILAAKRTPVARVRGPLRHVPPEGLAAAVLRASLDEARLEGEAVSQVILANAVGPGGNLARLAALQAGLPVRIPALTVDGQCGGALEAVRLAAALVRGQPDGCCVAGGVESVSQEPTRLTPDGRRMKRARFTPEAWGDPEMGEAAEALARRFGISRRDQDAWARRSVERFLQAAAAGWLTSEMVPVQLTGPGGETRDVCRDQGRSRPPSWELLARLAPSVHPEGTVTAGNTAHPADGAAALVLAATPAPPVRPGHLQPRRPLGRLVEVVAVGVEPKLPGLAAAEAIRCLLQRTGMRIDQIDLFEINEPFAAVTLACIAELGLPEDRVNIWGGALAVGHPYAAAGALLLVRLLHALHRTGGRHGIAAVPSAGGLGGAALVECTGPNAGLG